MTLSRRTLFQQSAALGAALALPSLATAQGQASQQRSFDPRPGKWRTFEITTRVDVPVPKGATRLWLPVPSIDSDWQQSLESGFTTNGQARFTSDQAYGAKMLQVEFPASESRPYVELTSRFRAQNRATDWSRRHAVLEDAASLAFWTQPTALLPTDGIVRKTALQATRGARSDIEKTRRIYDWVVANTYREPKVRGCGEGDIKTMLETGNLGGKCADLNALFVGLCRSVGVPARDVYGIRLARSEFGYKELSGNPASLKGAQHCRAEVYLGGHGWAAMDPADVAKVMRLETPEWIKTTAHPVVAPVNKALFGGWEGNWLGYNTAHDLALPGSKGPKLGFFMYPIGEDDNGRYDSYAPDEFKYQITAREA
ncbi:transglutaminase-like domain-containing protein [Quisquiliibacterium transsilvanicum]|uniref:Transglutaminase-like putative cysteine protease n=1 Tax=Quisquiliibacterium transsilvanicum TaxID=1549638 RepID=A0A7W8M9U7_9BURK|nr:transglutaminase domain-containing protein [Quisquiliibacterium transsilvanicum]MBB5273268.1 transglutaminase-like putative cysteine protease [Quisquiliibacterium transsilvanicum]